MLTSLLLGIPPAKLIRMLPLVETGKYQGREPLPIESCLYRLARSRSSELTSCCRQGILQGWSDCCPLGTSRSPHPRSVPGLSIATCSSQYRATRDERIPRRIPLRRVLALPHCPAMLSVTPAACNDRATC